MSTARRSHRTVRVRAAHYQYDIGSESDKRSKQTSPRTFTFFRCVFVFLVTQRRFALVLLLALSSSAYIVHHFLLDEYAWVHRRCLKAWIFPFDTVVQVECVEAAVHKHAMHDASLWDIPDQLDLERVPTPHLHYTITTPMEGPIMDLALCSMEASIRLCYKHQCIVHVWVVDQAARELLQKDSSIQSPEWFRRMEQTLAAGQYCFHIQQQQQQPQEREPTHSEKGDSMPSDELRGPACQSVTPCTTPDSQKLRAWLTATSLAQHQLPAHVSDAWRLLALVEYGGLYLDADVLPLTSSDLLVLPGTTIPTQHRVGAYRINGGLIKMPLPHACQHASFSLNHTMNENGMVRYSSYADALVADHLLWAPRLAKLPMEQQTFGFLGPCALTRVYLQHGETYREHVTLLSHPRAQPAITTTLCQDILAKKTKTQTQTLALHFHGKQKQNWKSIMKLGSGANGGYCRDLVESTCPRTFQEMGSN